MRRGTRSNTDAIDIGATEGVSSTGVVVESCLIHDFFDKGISVGDKKIAQGAVVDLLVRNCLIYHTTRGIQVKGESWITAHNNTIVDSTIGLHGFEKFALTGAGVFTNTYNNILANNTSAIVAADNTYIEVHHSDTEGTNWPGLNNINTDPLFLDAENRDYRLATNSPARGTGVGGADMGITNFVGGIPDPPSMLSAYPSSNSIVLTWIDEAENQTGTLLSRSTNAVNWTPIGFVIPNIGGFLDLGLTAGKVYYYRARNTNDCGMSPWSPIIRTVTPDDGGDTDSDGLPNSWELTYGFNPDDPNDALLDPDEDGMNTLNEYEAGTGPLDAHSHLWLRIAISNPVEQTLIFPTSSGHLYRLQSTTNLFGGNWTNRSPLIMGPGTLYQLGDTSLLHRVYYRVRVQRPE